MSFWVRRPIASDFVVNDLGVTIRASSERDLSLSFDTQVLTQSGDLVTALSSGALQRIDGPGGAVIPAADAFNDIDISAHIAEDFPHHPHANKVILDDITDAGSGVIMSTAERSKLFGIEAGAEVNDTGAEILTKLQGEAAPLALNVTQTGGATAAQLRDRATHTGSQTSSTISDFSAAADARITAQKGAAGGLATLDGTGKVPTAQIPASALPSFHVVADATARLALTVQEGDEAFQTDDSSQWIYDGASWFQRPAGSGDVNGPSSAVDNALVLFDGTTGKLIKDSATLLSALALAVRQIIAGAGLTGGGDLSADRTLNVVANADGSIAVNANDVQVGVLATDTQHGNRGGGSQHALAVAAGAAGFLSGADKAKLDALVWGTQYQNVENLGTMSTTGTAYVEFLRLTTPVIPAGRYAVEFYCEITVSANTRESEVLITMDGAITIAHHRERHELAADNHVISGVVELTLTSAAHFITMEFRRPGGTSATVTIIAGQLTIYRRS